MEKVRTNGQWIWGDDSIKPNDIVVFCKDFMVEKIPEKAEAILAAETHYYLWINGKQVVYEGGLFRESAPGCGWADRVDLAPYLQVGKNHLMIWVHYYGNGGRNNSRLPVGGLLLDCPALGLVSDNQFLWKHHPAFYTPGEPKPSYLYGGDNMGYDAQLDTDPNFEKAEGFQQAVLMDAAIYGDLYLRPIPQTRIEAECSLPEIRLDDKGVYHAKLPYAMTMTPVLDVRAKGGEVIRVRTDRWEVPGGPGDDTNRYHGHRLEFVCKPGENRLESLIAVFGEEILAEIPETVQIQRIACRNTGYDTEIVGDFHGSDPLLNRLIQKAARTLYVCMRDNFMDCPDRERGQWIGDVSVQVPQAAFLLDKRAMMLVKKAIHDFITLRKGDVLVGNVPGENFSELPAQSLAAISEWGLVAQYWKYSGDLETLKMVQEPAVRYLSLWQMGEDDLLVRRVGNWQWYDHLHNCDGPVIENAWYLSALKFMRKVADLTGNHQYDSFLEERISRISAAFETHFWKNGYYSSQAPLVDDRANALAVLAGVCPKERYPEIRKILISVFNATVYMENFVLTALCEMGYIPDAYRRMMSRYYNLAVNENSTLWEDFYLLGTKNHAWSGAPVTIAFRYFMGIDADAASGEWTVHPCWEIMEQMECRFPWKDQLVTVKADSKTRETLVISGKQETETKYSG